MGWLMAIFGGLLLINAFDNKGADFTTVRNEWQLGIGAGLIVLGAIVAIIRGED